MSTTELLRSALRVARGASMADRRFQLTLLVLGVLMRLQYSEGPLLQWNPVIAAALAQAATIVVLAIAELLRNRFALRQSSAAYVEALLVAGVAGAVAFNRLVPESTTAVSMATVLLTLVSVALVFLIHATFAVVAYVGREYRSAVEGIHSAREYARRVRLGAAREIAEERAALAAEARGRLVGVIDGLRAAAAGPGDVESLVLIERLRTLIDTGLRPLTRQLAEPAPMPELSEASSAPRIAWFAPRLSLRTVFRPEFLVLLPLPSALIGSYRLYGSTGLVPVLAVAFVDYVFMRLCIAFTPRQPIERAGALAFIVLLPCIAAAYGALLFAALVPPASDEPFRELYLRELGLTPILNLALAYVFAIVENLQDTRDRLAVIRIALRSEVARISQQQWVARRQWAHHIHGTVQSTLTSTLLMLQQVPVPWDRVRESLDFAAHGLSAVPTADLDLSECIERLQRTWQGICVVDAHVGDDVARVLAERPNSLYALNEVLKEAVSNAIRHGGATNIDIRLTRSGADVHVVVAGTPANVADGPRREGIGTQLFDEVSSTWTLVDGVLDLTLPLLDAGSSAHVLP